MPAHFQPSVILGAKNNPSMMAIKHTEKIADTKAITGSLFSFFSSRIFMLSRQIDMAGVTQYVDNAL